MMGMPGLLEILVLLLFGGLILVLLSRVFGLGSSGSGGGPPESKSRGFSLGHTMLTCPHCGQETRAGVPTCEQCGRDL